MRLALSLLAVVFALPAHAADPTPGELLKGKFADSKIFPGTTRDYTVYVPAQYDGKTPACLWVNQDGVQFNAPKVFDKLIAAKEMPVTIGVFVTPGVVPAPNADALPRYNRSFEYDGMGDAYARFLIDELLPTIEKLKTADGREIKLSKNPNDRAIAGSSSGAICAFTVAWERPDSFRRVFSCVGTYVGLRGGHEYPTLIRKTEPKPLRVFLEDGEGDLNNYAGDWWMANQTMERALTFAGYEVEHQWTAVKEGDIGKHNGKHATAIFPDAVRWLWKDHGKAEIKAGKGSPPMQQVLADGEGWKLVGEGYKFTEGPIANSQGEVFFTDVPAGKTFKVGADGKPVEVNADNGKASGFAFGPDGSFYGCGGFGLVKYEGGKSVKVADGFAGNDLVALHNGTFYATAPAGGKNEIYFIDAKGQKKVVDTGIKFPNGITTSPDQTLLYVAESRTHWVWSFQIQPDGTLKHKQKYFHLHVPDTADEASADGLKVDRDGRVYVATNMGVQFCDQPGRVNGIIPTPNGKCANICFGGEKFDTLYATCGDKVYCRKLKVTGYNHFDKPVTPKKPGL
ncbi:MAG: SMP-30/gluconolactonase/LRE family protein [Fimbriiglobus sp.]|jgi:sugar lactone lactonase YvrE|nr:SMP-30/gluconolactonase/LRE family protein [Fimbriiglobus sp.]